MGLEVCPRLVLLTLSVPETDVVGEDGGGGCDDMHAEVDELDVALGSSEGFGLVSKSVDDVEDVCHGLGVVILVGDCLCSSGSMELGVMLPKVL